MDSYAGNSEGELAAFLKQGDPHAFTELYDRYSDLLFKYAYRWLQDREAVKDVIQEVFTTIWAKHDRLHFEKNLSGYLYNAVRYGILRKIRQDQQARHYFSSLQTFIEQGESISDHRIREQQLRAIIEHEIAQLPPRMRECFELSRHQYLTYAQIAERLGISEETVRAQIKKALRILREKVALAICLYFLIKK